MSPGSVREGLHPLGGEGDILIIEDDRAMAEAVARILRFEGYRVDVAYSGVEGLLRAQQHTPALILCDIVLPQGDGFEILDSVRKDNRLAAVPFIFLSGRASPEEVRQGMERGADDYLVKPIAPVGLLKSVRNRLVRHAHQIEQVKAQGSMVRRSILDRLPHELLTPLTGIIGIGELLQKEPMSETAHELVGAIQQSGERLTRFFRKYILFAQLELANVAGSEFYDELHESTANAAEVAADVIHKIAIIHMRTEDMRVHLDNVRVPMDDRLWERVVGELVENACQYSPVGTPIDVALGLYEGSITLTVTDEGGGFKPEEVAALGPFVKFDRNVSSLNGLGLGLYLVKSLANLVGGRFDIESGGRGARVCVRMPVG